MACADNSLIPWGAVDPVETGKAPCENVAALTHDRLCKLSDVFETDTNQQLAFKTITSEVLRYRLAWHSREGHADDTGIPVPDWWETFVTDAVRSILINGCFCYRRSTTRAGVTSCIVADPAAVYVEWCEKRQRYISTCNRHRWRVVVVEAPHRGCDGRNMPWRIVSAAHRAYPATIQLQKLLRNWTERDRCNTKNTVYTTVSDELKQQNGSDRQWFRDVTTADSMPTRAPDVDVNFHTLVHRRAETVQKLDAITNLARERQSGANALSRVGDRLQDEEPPRVVEHAEHIVSDGRTYTEARQLGSMADSKLVMDELKHTILFAFGVPPQAVGRNINSERIASSNRLTEMAITTYLTLIRLYRQRIGDAIREETEAPSGSYIGFSVCLSHYELEKLQPVLKTDVCCSMMARAFDIPSEFIDSSKVKELAEAAISGGAPGAGGSTNSSVGGESRKRRKDYTEEDKARNLRNKANKPSV